MRNMSREWLPMPSYPKFFFMTPNLNMYKLTSSVGAIAFQVVISITLFSCMVVFHSIFSIRHQPPLSCLHGK